MPLAPDDLPDSPSKRLLRWGFHFTLGVFLSLPLAVIAFGVIGLSPTVDLAKAAFWIVLLWCTPCGIIAWLIGLIRRGAILYWFISVLGIPFRFWY